MTDARNLLRERSRSYLLETRHAVEAPFQEGRSTPEEREAAVTLARSLFVQLSRLLKLALDARDTESFIETERSWAGMFADIWVADEPEFQTPEQRDLAPLLRSRDVLRLGLAMWAAHLLAGPRAPEGQDMWRTALRVLAGRFTGIEQLLDVYDDAREREQGEGGDWTGWFLGELPEGQAHFIPTSAELLFVTLLIGARFAGTGDQVPLRPREWMRHGQQELDAGLERLERDPDRWAWLVGEADVTRTVGWGESVAALRRLLAEARTEALAREQAELRQAPVDPDRVRAFREIVLTQAAGTRLVRDTFARQGALERVAAPPDEHTTLVWRSWLPKTAFVLSSQVVGMEFIARDVARETNAEFSFLAEDLALLEVPAVISDADSIAEDVVSAIEDMSMHDLRPSLLLMPLAWRLKERLGLPVGRGAAPDSPLIPLAHRRRFAGLIHGVPAIDAARVSDDRLYLMDLRTAATFVEWPSEKDAGIDVKLQAFDAAGARELINEGRVVVGPGETADQVALRLQQQVLLSVTRCWTLRPGNRQAVRAFTVPTELRRTAQ
jgi:hypothetical protein